MAKSQATILTPEELRKTRNPLPVSMQRAAGLLRHKRKALERHLKQMRREWERSSS